MTLAGAAPKHLACGGDFEALCNRLARFATWRCFWHGKRGGKLPEFTQVARKVFHNASTGHRVLILFLVLVLSQKN
jgi:hypothetical protein